MATRQRQHTNRARACVAASALVAIRLAVLSLGFDRTQRLARRLARRARHIASTDQVLRTLDTVDAGAAWVPFRVACLEWSLATVLLLAARRRGVTWCMGVRTQPLAMHAWLVDPAGQPIGEPPGTPAYQPLVVIAPEHST